MRDVGAHDELARAASGVQFHLQLPWQDIRKMTTNDRASLTPVSMLSPRKPWQTTGQNITRSRRESTRWVRGHSPVSEPMRVGFYELWYIGFVLASRISCSRCFKRDRSCCIERDRYNAGFGACGPIPPWTRPAQIRNLRLYNAGIMRSRMLQCGSKGP